MISDALRHESNQLARHVRARARGLWDDECRAAATRVDPLAPRELAELRGADYRALLRSLTIPPPGREDGFTLATLCLLARACDVYPIDLLAGSGTVVAAHFGVVGPLAAAAVAAADRTNP
jgi:hypothetical protein